MAQGRKPGSRSLVCFLSASFLLSGPSYMSLASPRLLRTLELCRGCSPLTWLSLSSFLPFCHQNKATLGKLISIMCAYTWTLTEPNNQVWFNVLVYCILSDKLIPWASFHGPKMNGPQIRQLVGNKMQVTVWNFVFSHRLSTPYFSSESKSTDWILLSAQSFLFQLRGHLLQVTA